MNVGVDLIVKWRLFNQLLQSLNERDIIVLCQAFVGNEDSSMLWFYASSLGLYGPCAMEWDDYVKCLILAGIILLDASD